MWIVYVLTFVAGIILACLIDSVVECISEREKYSKLEFESRLKWRVYGVVWTSIIISTFVLISAFIAQDRMDEDLKTRVEKLEEKMGRYESLNQIDTIVIRCFIDEEDLK